MGRFHLYFSLVHPRFVQFGHLVLPTYGVVLAAGLIAALLLCLHLARLLSLNAEKIWNLALLAIAVTLAGAKLLLAAAKWPDYGAHALALSLVDSHRALLGGIAIALVACCLYAWRAKLPIRRSADALAPPLALLSSVASIACLEAGCDYGAPTRAPWAIVFTSPLSSPGTPLGVPLHPTQIYACLWEFVLFVFLLWLLYRPHRDGEIMGAWLFLGGLGDFFLMFLRGDAARYESFGGLLNVMQLVAVFMVLLGGFLWLRRAPIPSPVQPSVLDSRRAG